MRILLDTHVFLWYVNGAPEMPAALPQSPDLFFPVQRQAHDILSLGLDEASVAHLAQLPQLHRDPFDRILVCQAIEYGLAIATVDAAIHAYQVRVL